MHVALIIPTLNAARHFAVLMPALARLDPQPDERLIIDSSSTDGTAEIVTSWGWRVHTIARRDFGHGRTRNLAARLVRGDLLIYLTQDAVPQDPHLVSALLRPFADSNIAHTFGRQIPHGDATASARFSRFFNYPEESYRRSIADVARLGIKAFFTSNSCAAYRRTALEQIGGFPENTPTTEDNVAAARLMQRGYSMAYVADAVVAHSHNYSIRAEFSRYFDIGVSHALAPDLLALASVPEPEGMKFVRDELRFLARQGALLDVPQALARNVAKYAGYRLGRSHHRLSLSVKRKLCMHPNFWSTAASADDAPQ